MNFKPSGLFRNVLITILGSSILALIILGLLRSTSASAQSGDLENAEAKYTVIEGSRIDSCSFCHQGSPPALNAYGRDYLSHGRNNAAFTAIEGIDSDGDGYTNLQEITALSFPGSASDHPLVPTATTQPTSPPVTTATTQPTLPPDPLLHIIFVPMLSK